MCFVFIITSVLINIQLVKKYNITIGLVDVNNFYLLQAIISKPWTKLGNIGLAGFLACFYYRLIKLREASTPEEK